MPPKKQKVGVLAHVVPEATSINRRVIEITVGGGAIRPINSIVASTKAQVTPGAVLIKTFRAAVDYLISEKKTIPNKIKEWQDLISRRDPIIGSEVSETEDDTSRGWWTMTDPQTIKDVKLINEIVNLAATEGIKTCKKQNSSTCQANLLEIMMPAYLKALGDIAPVVSTLVNIHSLTLSSTERLNSSKIDQISIDALSFKAHINDIRAKTQKTLFIEDEKMWSEFELYDSLISSSYNSEAISSDKVACAETAIIKRYLYDKYMAVLPSFGPRKMNYANTCQVEIMLLEELAYNLLITCGLSGFMKGNLKKDTEGLNTIMSTGLISIFKPDLIERIGLISMKINSLVTTIETTFSIKLTRLKAGDIRDHKNVLKYIVIKLKQLFDNYSIELKAITDIFKQYNKNNRQLSKIAFYDMACFLTKQIWFAQNKRLNNIPHEASADYTSFKSDIDKCGFIIAMFDLPDGHDLPKKELPCMESLIEKAIDNRVIDDTLTEVLKMTAVAFKGKLKSIQNEDQAMLEILKMSDCCTAISKLYSDVNQRVVCLGGSSNYLNCKPEKLFRSETSLIHESLSSNPRMAIIDFLKGKITIGLIEELFNFKFELPRPYATTSPDGFIAEINDKITQILRGNNSLQSVVNASSEMDGAANGMFPDIYNQGSDGRLKDDIMRVELSRGTFVTITTSCETPVAELLGARTRSLFAYIGEPSFMSTLDKSVKLAIQRITNPRSKSFNILLGKLYNIVIFIQNSKTLPPRLSKTTLITFLNSVVEDTTLPKGKGRPSAVKISGFEFLPPTLPKSSNLEYYNDLFDATLQHFVSLSLDIDVPIELMEDIFNKAINMLSNSNPESETRDLYYKEDDDEGSGIDARNSGLTSAAIDVKRFLNDKDMLSTFFAPKLSRTYSVGPDIDKRQQEQLMTSERVKESHTRAPLPPSVSSGFMSKLSSNWTKSSDKSDNITSGRSSAADTISRKDGPRVLEQVDLELPYPQESDTEYDTDDTYVGWTTQLAREAEQNKKQARAIYKKKKEAREKEAQRLIGQPTPGNDNPDPRNFNVFQPGGGNTRKYHTTNNRKTLHIKKPHNKLTTKNRIKNFLTRKISQYRK